MRKLLIIAAAVLLININESVFVFGQKRSGDIRKISTEQLVQDFVSNDWSGKVAPAKSELESRQAHVIPGVIKLLDRDEYVKLKNTADLIYPGAETFYGHGWVLDYDVDQISVRAGWLLEELTFVDFGFREGVVDHDEILTTVIKGKSDSYIHDLKEKLKGKDSKKQGRILAIQKAKDWFESEGKTWSRFDAIVRGLKGRDAALQYRIFQWLRNEETRCDGLTIASFKKILLPEVKRLSKSTDKDIREETQHLLEDYGKENWWFRHKLQRDFPDTYTSMELK